jgi:hypothetical protein
MQPLTRQPIVQASFRRTDQGPHAIQIPWILFYVLVRQGSASKYCFKRANFLSRNSVFESG